MNITQSNLELSGILRVILMVESLQPDNFRFSVNFRSKRHSIIEKRKLSNLNQIIGNLIEIEIPSREIQLLQPPYRQLHDCLDILHILHKLKGQKLPFEECILKQKC